MAGLALLVLSVCSLIFWGLVPLGPTIIMPGFQAIVCTTVIWTLEITPWCAREAGVCEAQAHRTRTCATSNLVKAITYGALGTFGQGMMASQVAVLQRLMYPMGYFSYSQAFMAYASAVLLLLFIGFGCLILAGLASFIAFCASMSEDQYYTPPTPAGATAPHLPGSVAASASSGPAAGSSASSTGAPKAGAAPQPGYFARSDADPANPFYPVATPVGRAQPGESHGADGFHNYEGPPGANPWTGVPQPGR